MELVKINLLCRDYLKEVAVRLGCKRIALLWVLTEKQLPILEAKRQAFLQRRSSVRMHNNTLSPNVLGKKRQLFVNISIIYIS